MAYDGLLTERRATIRVTIEEMGKDVTLYKSKKESRDVIITLISDKPLTLRSLKRESIIVNPFLVKGGNELRRYFLK